MTHTLEDALAAVRNLRDDARLSSDRLCAVWEGSRSEGAWVESDALGAYQRAESHWQGLQDAVHAMEQLQSGRN